MHLAAVADYLRDEASAKPPVSRLHSRVLQGAQRHEISLEGLTVVGPIGYQNMTRLLSGAAAGFVESCVLQTEAYFHRVPWTTLRDETEWTETVTHGCDRPWKGPPYGPRTEIADDGRGRVAFRFADALRN